jgi:hypothetical protein
MKEQIEELEELKLKITANLREWVKDKSISLDERWNLFFKSDLGDHKTYHENFVNFKSDEYCNNLNRYKIIDLSNAINYKNFSDEIQYDDFRENVLNKFIKSFKWDW